MSICSTLTEALNYSMDSGGIRSFWGSPFLLIRRLILPSGEGEETLQLEKAETLMILQISEVASRTSGSLPHPRCHLYNRPPKENLHLFCALTNLWMLFLPWWIFQNRLWIVNIVWECVKGSKETSLLLWLTSKMMPKLTITSSSLHVPKFYMSIKIFNTIE